MGLTVAVRRLAVRKDRSCCSNVAAKAAGLEKSRFFERQQHELGSHLLRVVGDVLVTQLGVFLQGGVNGLFLGGVGHFQGLRSSAWESGRSRRTFWAAPT